MKAVREATVLSGSFRTAYRLPHETGLNVEPLNLRLSLAGPSSIVGMQVLLNRINSG
jgi:hypothetical protein